jgi:hypothetical protein
LTKVRLCGMLSEGKIAFPCGHASHGNKKRGAGLPPSPLGKKCRDPCGPQILDTCSYVSIPGLTRTVKQSYTRETCVNPRITHPPHGLWPSSHYLIERGKAKRAKQNPHHHSHRRNSTTGPGPAGNATGPGHHRIHRHSAIVHTKSASVAKEAKQLEPTRTHTSQH